MEHHGCLQHLNSRPPAALVTAWPVPERMVPSVLPWLLHPDHPSGRLHHESIPSHSVIGLQLRTAAHGSSGEYASQVGNLYICIHTAPPAIYDIACQSGCASGTSKVGRASGYQSVLVPALFSTLP